MYSPSVQQDLKNATTFINSSIQSKNLSASLNNRLEIEIKDDRNTVVKRIDGAHIAKVMSGVDTYA